jgi:hypothetical protein
MFRQFPFLTALPNLTQQISLIRLLSTLKIPQRKHGLSFILYYNGP